MPANELQKFVPMIWSLRRRQPRRDELDVQHRLNEVQQPATDVCRCDHEQQRAFESGAEGQHLI